MIKYQKNNILFRITSSDAICKFKRTQAHSFLQLIRKELDFDVGAKEIVLLEYDRFSQWIFRIERICLAAGEGEMTDSLKLSIIESFHDELRIIENVIESHPDVFSPKVVALTKLIHKYSVGMVYESFEEFANTNKIDMIYAKIVDYTSSYLQHILVAMHEFNNNLIKKNRSPFICFSEFCVNANKGKLMFMPDLVRAKFFAEHEFIDEFIFKNYSAHDIFIDAKSYFKENDLRLIPEIQFIENIID